MKMKSNVIFKFTALRVVSLAEKITSPEKKKHLNEDTHLAPINHTHAAMVKLIEFPRMSLRAPNSA